MKRLLAAILILVCMVTIASAYADAYSTLQKTYNKVAEEFGTKKIDNKNSKKMTDALGTHILSVDFGKYKTEFCFRDDKDIYAISILLKDKSKTMEFLFTCMTTMAVFGKTDYDAFSELFIMFKNVESRTNSMFCSTSERQ